MGVLHEQMRAGGGTAQGLGMLDTTDLCRHRDDRRPLRIVVTLALPIPAAPPVPVAPGSIVSRFLWLQSFKVCSLRKSWGGSVHAVAAIQLAILTGCWKREILHLRWKVSAQSGP